MRRLLPAVLAAAALSTATPAYADLCEGIDAETSRVGYCVYEDCSTLWLDLVKQIQDDGIAVSVCGEGARRDVCVVDGREYFCVI